MTWKRRVVDASAERELITGLIVSTDFTKTIIPSLRLDLIEASFARTVARWCVDYYHKYEKAPGAVIQELFDAERNDLDDSVAELIENYLADLSDKYTESFNVEYSADNSESYLKRRNLEQLKADITACLTRNEIGEAEASVANFKRIERYAGESVDVLNDREAIAEAFHEEHDDLFTLPGDLGKLIKTFARGDLIAVAAPGKRGKTWWLQEIGVRALFAGLKVVFISLEMSRSQMIRRFYQNILGEPRRIREDEEHMVIEVPCFNAIGEIVTKEIHRSGLSVAKALRKVDSLKKMVKTGRFHLLSFPTNSIGVSGISTSLDNLEHYSKFVPDVIIVDYADYLMPEIKAEVRHQIDHTWKGLRGMAEKRHCLVVTATHTNKLTYSKDIDQDDLSEDNRKLNHVACMFALNQKPEEKRRGVMRVSLLASRHDVFDIEEQVIVLSNLTIGKPYLDSRFEKFVAGI